MTPTPIGHHLWEPSPLGEQSRLRVAFFSSFIFVIANLAQQGVAISRFRLPQSLALLRNDNVSFQGSESK